MDLRLLLPVKLECRQYVSGSSSGQIELNDALRIDASTAACDTNEGCLVASPAQHEQVATFKMRGSNGESRLWIQVGGSCRLLGAD